MGERSVIAMQPDLFGAAEKPCHSWRRPYFTWNWCGEKLPLSDDALRQNAMLHPDSHDKAAAFRNAIEAAPSQRNDE